MTLTLHFLRHAKPALTGVLLGRTDCALAPLHFSAGSMVDVNKLTRIYSSPLLRCQQTATPFAEQSLCPVEVAAALREMDFGVWDGKPYEQLWQRTEEGAQIGDFWQDPWAYTPPQGETMETFHARVVQWWQSVLAQPCVGEWLIVSHAGVMKILLLAIFGNMRPSGEQLAAIEFSYLCGFKVEVYFDEQVKAWPKVVF
ncbi:histidine phosphatase family protein [Pseudoalteromonas fenneropenaei]|uniref:Histidine phosphatase family protein n=1 Tax=Pseudoalteromonas fenneropenaei TaxID=1737459 RepID=A0ABV7CLC4_9GAMM